MRTASVSLVVIALALASIVAGFLGAQASTHPPPIVIVRRGMPPVLPSSPVPASKVRGFAHGLSDEAIVDPFSNDDVVVEHPASARWIEPRVAIVIGLCGNSRILDAQFLRLGVPLAFDLDPQAPEAAAFARLVRASGDMLFVHVGTPPSAEQVRVLRSRLGAFDGIGSAAGDAMAPALQHTGLMFFDETGQADTAPFVRANVPMVSRDVTADNRSSRSYIEYMLAQSATRARREGRIVILMRPLPDSLDALTNFLGKQSAEAVALR